MTTADGNPRGSDPKYTRTHFAPADVGYGPVTVRDAEGHVIRRIAVKALLAMESAVPDQHAVQIPPRQEFPEYHDRRKGKVRG